MMVPDIHQDHTESDTTPYSQNLKPTLLMLAITQALSIQAVQAASIEVTSNLDDGTDCTLREAINSVNAGVDQINGCIINGALGTADAISFGAGVAGSTIVTNDELTITRSVRINSGGAHTTIDANGVGRVIGIDLNTTVELDQLTLTGGFVTGGFLAGDGGGISAYYSDVTLTKSTVSGNSVDGAGGGIYAYGSDVTLTDSTVSGNTAGNGGGGIFANTYSDVKLSNSTVSGNTASFDGGGISANRYSDVMLSNSTVSGNIAGSSGGGINTSRYSVVMLSNSIVANSTGADCVNSYSTTTAMADSIIEDGSCGTAAMAVDPVLSPLTDNGGPTQTHALLAGSPAIDNATATGATASDQRGVAAVGVRDSGAYEFTAAMNALMIDKLINHHVRPTPDTAAELLVGTRYRTEYKVTNNSPNRIYSVRVFEDGKLVCNLYDMLPGQSKQPNRCANSQAVLAGLNYVPANVTAKVSGSNQALLSQTDAYYIGFGDVSGKLNVTHYVNNRNADTQSSAATVNGKQAEILFRVENTGSIKLYRVKTYHDPASPINSGWEEQCFFGTLMPGQVRYCKRTISVTQEGLNKAVGHAQGEDANVSPMGFVNASNPTYFNVVLP